MVEGNGEEMKIRKADGFSQKDADEKDGDRDEQRTRRHEPAQSSFEIQLPS